jgi:hypothetical protein
MRPQTPANPTEQTGGGIEKQFALAKAALQYGDRFKQSDESAALDARFAEAEKAAGIAKK